MRLWPAELITSRPSNSQYLKSRHKKTILSDGIFYIRIFNGVDDGTPFFKSHIVFDLKKAASQFFRSPHAHSAGFGLPNCSLLVPFIKVFKSNPRKF
jgi:hypothetical protein